jgi:hypothetical protein
MFTKLHDNQSTRTARTFRLKLLPLKILFVVLPPNLPFKIVKKAIYDALSSDGDGIFLILTNLSFGVLQNYLVCLFTHLFFLFERMMSECPNQKIVVGGKHKETFFLKIYFPAVQFQRFCQSIDFHTLSSNIRTSS